MKHLLTNVLFLKGTKKVLITHCVIWSVQLVTYTPWEHGAFKIITLMASPIIISDLLRLICVDIPIEKVIRVGYRFGKHVEIAIKNNYFIFSPLSGLFSGLRDSCNSGR